MFLIDQFEKRSGFGLPRLGLTDRASFESNTVLTLKEGFLVAVMAVGTLLEKIAI